MRTSLTSISFVLAVAALSLSSPSSGQSGQRREGLPRNQTSGVANPVANGVFKVVSVDSYARSVQMQGAAGAITVRVDEGIYDISKLKPDEYVQVNFLVPDGKSNQLSAAGIWPLKAPK